MQAIVTKQEAITDDFRRIQFIHQGQTIVTVSQTIRHKLDAKPRVADLNWGALSSASFEQVEAIGYALLEAVAIAREWSKIVEETDVTNHSPKLFMVRHDERRLRG